MADDADEWRATHGGSIEGYSGGGDKGDYKAPAKTFTDPRTVQSAGAGAAGPQRKDFPDGLQGDADYSKSLRRYRSTVANGQRMAMSKDSSSAGIP